jgi:putative PIN family toxin of toxin-antitoxin system
VRVFLDTNVLVSAFATRGLCSDVVRVVLAEHTLLTSELVLRELRRALRLRIRMPANIAAEIEALLREHELVPTPTSPPAVPVRDPDDRWVLAAAIAAKADVLVTGDRDLLDIAKQAPIEIVDPRSFWQTIRES